MSEVDDNYRSDQLMFKIYFRMQNTFQFSLKKGYLLCWKTFYAKNRDQIFKVSNNGNKGRF